MPDTTKTGTKWVYTFGDGKAEGRRDMRELLGGKGANLAEMTSIGLPVPCGFTITTEVCDGYYQAGRKLEDTPRFDVHRAARSATQALESAQHLVARRAAPETREALHQDLRGARRPTVVLTIRDDEQ